MIAMLPGGGPIGIDPAVLRGKMGCYVLRTYEYTDVRDHGISEAWMGAL